MKFKWLRRAFFGAKDWLAEDSAIAPRLRRAFRVWRGVPWRRKGTKLFHLLMRQSVGRVRAERILSEVVQLGPEKESVSDFRWLFAPRIIEIDEARHADLLAQSRYFNFAPIAFKTPFVCRLHNPKIHLGEGVLLLHSSIILDSAFARYRLVTSTVFGALAPGEVPVLKGCYSSVWGLFASNTFHWIVDCLPRLHSLELATEKPLTLLMPASATSYQRESLACCLPDGMEVRYMENLGWLQVEEFVFPSYVTLPQFAALPPEYSEALRQLVWTRLNLSSKVGARRRIYISRRNATHRRVLNETEVTRCLEKWGFESVLLEEMTFQQQVELFYDAEIVVGGHGAGLTNILFSKSVKIIELQGAEVLLHYFFLAQSLSHRYASVVAPPRVGSSHFVVPIEKLEARLGELLKSPA